MQEVPDGRMNSKYPTNNLDLVMIIIGFCLTTTTGLVLIRFQVPTGQLPLPVIFDFLGLLVCLAFTCFLVSKCIHISYCPAGVPIARLFRYFGLFFGVTAIYMTITVPFPSRFKCAAYSIYGTAFLIVLFSNIHFYICYKPHGLKHPTPNNSISTTAIDPVVESCWGGTSSVDDPACTNRNEDICIYIS